MDYRQFSYVGYFSTVRSRGTIKRAGVPAEGKEMIRRGPKKLALAMYGAIVVAASLALVVFTAVTRPEQLVRWDVLYWTVVLAVVAALAVPTWRGTELSVSSPILLAVAILYSPGVAATVALLGSTDLREVRREVSLTSALFNRAQFAFSVLAAGSVFHAVARAVPTLMASPWYKLLAASVAATAVIYTVNTVLVAVFVSLGQRISVRAVLTQLRVGALPQFLVNYLGLSVIGLGIALFSVQVGEWSVVLFLAPLVFARQMFFRSMALEEASKELKDRERVMRALSNRMAEERQDERLQIAGYLHDDLAQTLFQLTLRLEMAKKRLAHGDAKAAAADLDDITEIKEKASTMVRSLVRDLHRVPIGRNGLGDAIKSFAEEVSKGSKTRIAVDVPEVSLPPPIQLLAYQIAREAVMNSLRHADPQNVWVALTETDEGAELRVRDDGAGFDVSQGPPEGHFGTVMMRERATVAGGRFEITSEPGNGTTVVAAFPRVWPDDEESAPGGGKGPEQAGSRAAARRGTGPDPATSAGEIASTPPGRSAPRGVPA